MPNCPDSASKSLTYFCKTRALYLAYQYEYYSYLVSGSFFIDQFAVLLTG
jgi:hypothetical protein